MSSAEDTLPFPRGTTALANLGQTLTSSDADQLVGREFQVLDWDFSTLPRTLRSHRKVKVRVVRNTSGIALLPRQLVVLEPDLVTNGNTSVAGAGPTANAGGKARVGSTSSVLPAKCYPVDEWLPAAGCPANDLFYVVIDGPAEVYTGRSALAAAIAVGDAIVAQTAATSQAATAGYADVVTNTLAAATTTPAGLVKRIVGKALTALATGSTGQTSTRLLIDVGGF